MILVGKYIQIFHKIQELVGENIQNIQALIVKKAGPQSVGVGAQCLGWWGGGVTAGSLENLRKLEYGMWISSGEISSFFIP